MPDFVFARARMVESQIVRRGIEDARVIAAMAEVPREAFVDAEAVDIAYRDGPVWIGQGQSISQPYIVAVMLEAAGLAAGKRALEIGAGSGYAAAVMSRIAGCVHAVERLSSLATLARERLSRLGYDNIRLHSGDGTLGWPAAAPFDAVVVSAGSPEVPLALKQQLAVGGRLVIPVGATRHRQRLLRIERVAMEQFVEQDLGGVAFVPLIGAQGWGGQT